MSGRYEVKRLDELASYDYAGRAQWFPIRMGLGVAAFGINAWRAGEPGQTVIDEHDELGDGEGTGAGGHEELYVVLAGRATFAVAGETLDAPQGTLVFVRDPATKRGAVAVEAGTTVLVAGAKAGEAFTPSDWEAGAEALRFWETREYDQAIELLTRRHAEQPGNGTVLYNLACAESLTGRRDDALAHLELAVALSPRFRRAAQTDPDFEAVREDPRFPRADA